MAIPFLVESWLLQVGIANSDSAFDDRFVFVAAIFVVSGVAVLFSAVVIPQVDERS